MYFLVSNLKADSSLGNQRQLRGYNYLLQVGQRVKADGKIPWALNLAQAAAGAFIFPTSLLYRYFSGKCLKATPLSFLCVLKRRVFVTSRLFYDACFAEKSQDLIYP